MLKNNDHKDYLLYKPEEKSLDVADGSREKGSSCISSLSKMLGILYQFSIGSCIHSLLSCSDYFRSDEPHERQYESVELDALCPGNLKKAQESKKSIRDTRMKEKINLHFQSHLQKWKRKHFPFKVTLHLLLVVLVTAQVSGL